MRLLVVTNCRAQVALEVVLQQEQAHGSALGLEGRADDCGSIRAWIQLDRRSPAPHLTLSYAAKTVMPSPKCQTMYTHTPLPFSWNSLWPYLRVSMIPKLERSLESNLSHREVKGIS